MTVPWHPVKINSVYLEPVFGFWLSPCDNSEASHTAPGRTIMPTSVGLWRLWFLLLNMTETFAFYLYRDSGGAAEQMEAPGGLSEEYSTI